MRIFFWKALFLITIPACLFVDALSPPTRPKPSATSRRSFLRRPVFSAASAIVVSSLSTTTSARAVMGESVTDGMAAFARGEVERSIEIYDAIIAADPRRKPYLWQRGLSLYYARRYRDGADQFAADVAVNPNDTEEQIWHLLCLAQLTGSLEEARSKKLTVGRDRRPVMRAAQSLFLSGEAKDEQELVGLAENGDVGSRFYASLYLSLYYESTSNESEAAKWMVQAVNTDYAKSAGRKDHMVELANVAVNKRGWASSAIK